MASLITLNPSAPNHNDLQGLDGGAAGEYYHLTMAEHAALSGVAFPSSGTLYSDALDSITSAQLAGSLTDETGTGVVVFNNSPTLVTPSLGAATATSINGLSLTTSTGTLTIDNGSSLITSGAFSLTLTATGNTNVTFPTSGTLATLSDVATKEPTISDGTVSEYYRGDKTWRNFFAAVRASTLNGLSLVTGTAITAADTVLAAFGKLQKQITDNLSTLTTHTGNTSNPHSVTKTQVGLSNVDNTSDLSKPISTATQTALDAKVAGPASATDNAIARYNTTTGKLVQNSTAIIDDNGNMGVGAPTIAARLHAKGEGTTSATVGFRVDNSTGTKNFEVLDDGSGYLRGSLETRDIEVGLAYRVGYQAAFAATGTTWHASGRLAGYSNTTGSFWYASGRLAGYSSTTGSSWHASGSSAGYSNTTGNSWYASGRAAGYGNIAENDWYASGNQAARYLADGTSSATSFSDSCYVGNNTRVSANGVTNENVFGHGAIGEGSNTVTLGNAAIVETHLRGTIIASGIPTSSTGLPTGAIWNDSGTLKIV